MTSKLFLCLIFLLAFFASWGEGMQNVLSHASLIYPILNFLFIIYYLFRYKSVYFYSKYYKYFVIYMVFHTVVFLMFHHDYFILERSVKYSGNDDFILMNAGKGEIILRYFSYLFSSLILASCFKNNKILNTFLFAYSVGFSLTVFFGGYNADYSGIVRFSGGLTDPNAMGFDALLSLVFSFYLFKLHSNYRIYRYVHICTFILALYAILISLSRGTMLALFICFIYYLYKSGLLRLRGLFSSIFVVCLFILIFYQVVPENLKILLEQRFENEDFTGAGRTLIWNNYLSAWESYLFFGTGLTNCISALYSINTTDFRVTHNQYLLYLVEFGLIGFFLYCKYWFVIYKAISKLIDKELILSIVIVAFLVASFFLNLESGRTYWIVIAIANYLYSNKKYIF